MKKLTYLFIFSISICFSQTIEYDNLYKKFTYEAYVSKNGDTIKVGDSLTIGLPSTDNGFNYISQGGQKVANHLSNKKVIIHKLKTYGEKRNGYKMYVHFKGYGIPVLIDYETAIDIGEIYNPNAKLTRKQAIDKLKEHKDLFDLGLISIQKYNLIKKELTPIIMEN